MGQVAAESADRIISELRKEANEIKHLIAAESGVPDRPEVAVRVSRPLGEQVRRPDGERSFQIKFMLRNKSRGPANIRSGCSYLTIDGRIIPCADGELVYGCRLPQQNETRELLAHTTIGRWSDAEPALVCVKLEVEQDDGAVRYYIPRVGGSSELVEHNVDSQAGQRWMMRPRVGRPPGPVALLYPSESLTNGWTVRDDDGRVFDALDSWLVPTGRIAPRELADHA